MHHLQALERADQHRHRLEKIASAARHWADVRADFVSDGGDLKWADLAEAESRVATVVLESKERQA